MTGKISEVLDVLKMAKELSSKIVGEKSVSIRLDCMVNIAVQTTTIHVGSSFAKWAMVVE